MEFPPFWFMVIVIQLLAIQRCIIADDCIFVYTQQPPSCFSCNPYNNETSPPQLQLTLACGAQRTDDKKNQWTFDLRWFSNYSSNALDFVPHVRTPSFNSISVLVTSPGQYWCQVLDYTDGGPGQYSGRSNVAEVLSWEWYSSLPLCKGVQSVMESKCADLSCPIPSVSPTINIQAHTISELTSPLSPSTSIEHKSTPSQANGVPHISASAVAEGGCGCISTMVGVLVPMVVLILLLMAGIVIAFFLGKRLNSNTKPKAGSKEEQETSRNFEKVQQEGCGDAPPQTIEYEEIIPLGISANPTTDGPSKSHEPLSLQLINNVAYGRVRKAEQNTERDPSRRNQAEPSKDFGQKRKPCVP